MQPKISVVIPTYNRGYILRDAIGSVLEQSFTDIEVVVVDDGSTDDTRDIVANLADSRIRYVSHASNRGCSAAYNTGIVAASGEFVAFLDSDDMWKPDYLDRQISFFSRHPEADAVFSDTEIRGAMVPIPSLIGLMGAFRSTLAKYPKGPEYLLTEREMFICLLEEVPIKPSAVIIRKRVFDKVGVFDEGWPSGTDWDLFLRCARSVRFGYVDAPLVLQRQTDDSTFNRFREKDKLFLLSVFLKEKVSLKTDPEALRAINRGICSHYNSLAWIYLQSGRVRPALATYFWGFVETRQPRMLKKMASGALRAALGGIVEMSGFKA